MESDIARDGRTAGKPTGGYEWWYFDAVETDGSYRLVVIFYEGNPFSRRYLEALEERGGASPEEYPALSISLYREGETLFYSFTEYAPGEAEFKDRSPEMRIGSNRLLMEGNGGEVTYRLELDERLPAGDTLSGELLFRGPPPDPALFRGESTAGSGAPAVEGHRWNLALPRARVEGALTLGGPAGRSREISFRGTGYHDHNSGDKPLAEAFREWYWGRFHFEAGTLVYYAMNMRHGVRHRAWLLGRDGRRIRCRLDEMDLEDRGRTLFGLRPARRIRMSAGSDEAACTVQQAGVLDSGPFYQRYDSRAFLSLPGAGAIESDSGFAEYLNPGRISRRVFRPLVDMRIHYRQEGPHWVQRSRTLYRWTW